MNHIYPSPVNNRMMRSIEKSFSAGHGDEIRKQFEAAIPLRRYTEPIEIAKLFFISCKRRQPVHYRNNSGN